MEKQIAVVLRALIEAVAHMLPPGRAGELASLADEALGVIADGTEPPAGPAEVPGPS